MQLSCQRTAVKMFYFAAVCFFAVDLCAMGPDMAAEKRNAAVSFERMTGITDITGFLKIEGTGTYNVAAYSGNDKAAGGELSFIIRKFAGDTMVQGRDVDLIVRKREFGPGKPPEYYITGGLFGRQFDLMNAIKIKRDEFYPNPLMMSGAGADIRFTARPEFKQMQAEGKMEESATPRVITALMQVFDSVPAAVLSASKTGKAPQPSAAAASAFTFQDVSPDLFTVTGREINISVRLRRFSSGVTYEIRGRGFGKNFDAADKLVIETDRIMWGSGGYRISGCGISLEVLDRTIGGSQRIEVSGNPGDSAELSFFAMSVIHYSRQRWF